MNVNTVYWETVWPTTITPCEMSGNYYANISAVPYNPETEDLRRCPKAWAQWMREFLTSLRPRLEKALFGFTIAPFRFTFVPDRLRPRLDPREKLKRWKQDH